MFLIYIYIYIFKNHQFITQSMKTEYSSYFMTTLNRTEEK